MGSRPRFRSPCVTAPAHLLPYAPLYPLLPVLTRCAASYPPGLAALCRVPAVLRGLRLAWSPLAIASRRPRSSPNPGYRLPARSAAPPSPPLIPLCLSTGWTRCSPSSLSSCRMGRRPRSRGACGQTESPVRSGTPPTGARQRGGGSAPRRPGERSAPSPVRPSCGACEISRPRQPRPPARPGGMGVVSDHSPPPLSTTPGV